MSILGADTYNELTQTLQALQSPDNAIRSQAEEYLQNSWVNTRPEYLLLGLAEHISNSSDVLVCDPLYILFISPFMSLPLRAVLSQLPLQYCTVLTPSASFHQSSDLSPPLSFAG